MHLLPLAHLPLQSAAARWSALTIAACLCAHAPARAAQAAAPAEEEVCEATPWDVPVEVSAGLAPTAPGRPAASALRAAWRGIARATPEASASPQRWSLTPPSPAIRTARGS